MRFKVKKTARKFIDFAKINYFSKKVNFLSGRLRNGMIEQKKSFFKVFFYFCIIEGKRFYFRRTDRSSATENKFCGFLRKVKKDDKKN